MIVSIIFCNKIIDCSNVFEILLLIVEGSEALLLLFDVLVVELLLALLLFGVFANETLLMVNVLTGENIFRDTI